MDSKKRLWIYTGLALVAGVGLVTVVSKSSATKAPGAPLKRLGPGAKLLLVGDSLAQGLATPMRQLAQGAGVAFAADGRVGTRIDQWAQQMWLKTALSSFGPSVVLISLGTNDMKLPSPEAQRPMLAAVLATVRSYGALPLLIGPPTMPFPDRGIRSLLQTSGADVFPSESASISRAPDGIHPTAAGYAGWAALLWKWTDSGTSGTALAGVPHRRRSRHKRVDRRRNLASS